MIEYKIVLELLKKAILIYYYNNNKVDEKKIKDKQLIDIEDYNMNIIKYFNNSEIDAQGAIIINKEEKYICAVFRGSESLKDFYYDTKIIKHKLKDNIYIHRGFHKNLISSGMYDELATELKKQIIDNPDYKIYITGHSLGSANASLFGYLLSHEIENDIVIVAFASPRVGNYEWYKSFMNKKNLKQYRVCNNRDLVTALPIFRYYHVGENIQLFNNKYFVSNTDNSIFKYWRVSDHFCDSYYKNLKLIKW